MAGNGGYQAPANPAPVSGPGAMSARTDGNVLDPNEAPYGEGAEIASLKAAAPTGPTTQQPAPGGGGAAMPDFSGVTGLAAPSQNSDPVTSGAAAGPGPGAASLGLPLSADDEKRADVRALPDGMLQAMILAAGTPDATPSFKRRVREMLANS